MVRDKERELRALYAHLAQLEARWHRRLLRAARRMLGGGDR